MENKNNNYGYYSKLLQKPFDTLEELKIAEDEFNKKNEVELKQKEERKADSQAVSDAYANYVKVSREANNAIQEAKNDWIMKRDAFIAKYKSYHMTYSNIDGKEEVKTDSLFSDLFDDLLDGWSGIFSTFHNRLLK